MSAVILGAGTYGEVYYQYLKDDGKVNVVGFTDDDENKKSVLGVPVISKTRAFDKLADHKITDVFCSIGNNNLRIDLLSEAEAHGFQIPNYFHSSSIIAPDAQIGKGVYILAGTIVMPRATIGNYVMISAGSRIIHHSVLADGVFISSGVTLGAQVLVDECAFIGMGATVMTGVKRIGKNAVVGAGAVVTKDVPDNAVVAGVPAKILRIKE